MSLPPPQCWHERVDHARLNHGSSYTSLPSRGSPNLDPLKCHRRTRNGHLPSSTPRQATHHPPSSDETGSYLMVARSDECEWNIPRQPNGRKFVHFQDGKKKVIQQQQATCVVAAPITIHELQASPANLGKSGARYNFHTPRKPPRTFSQTSLTKSPATRGSFTSLCSASQPYPHTIRSTSEWDCPQAPLAEDEVKDAYAFLQPSGG